MCGGLPWTLDEKLMWFLEVWHSWDPGTVRCRCRSGFSPVCPKLSIMTVRLTNMTLFCTLLTLFVTLIVLFLHNIVDSFLPQLLIINVMLTASMLAVTCQL